MTSRTGVEVTKKIGKNRKWKKLDGSTFHEILNTLFFPGHSRFLAKKFDSQA